VLEPLQNPSHLGPLLVLLVACGAAPSPEPKASTADAGAKLEQATAAHSALATQLAAAPQDILAHCRTTGGDCLISVAEKREAVVGKYYLNACRDSDPAKQSPCIAAELEQRGERSALAAFYETENWCSRKLLECMSAFAKDSERMAHRQRTQDRRAQVEAAAESATDDRAAEFAKERLAFVRAILPPNGQAACPPATPEDCEKRLETPNAALDAELEKAPAAYDKARALALYTAVQSAEAECSAPELSCLLGELGQYGGSPETNKLLKQNLGLLTDQQRIRASANPEAAEQCLSAGVTQHSDRIVSAYQTYAASPVTYSLLRLQKAFIAMHQAQLWCLMPLGKRGKR
jgi:hypothetical protein